MTNVITIKRPRVRSFYLFDNFDLLIGHICISWRSEAEFTGMPGGVAGNGAGVGSVTGATGVIGNGAAGVGLGIAGIGVDIDG